MPDIPLDLLDQITIAAPCSARWEDMEGDDKSRHCDQCDLQVHNIAAMTRAEAESLIRSADGRLCARLYRRPDGTVLTEDCPVGLRRIARVTSRGGHRLVGAFVLAIVGTVCLATGRDRAVLIADLNEREPFARMREWLNPSPFRGQMVLGDVCLPPIPPLSPGYEGDPDE